MMFNKCIKCAVGLIVAADLAICVQAGVFTADKDLSLVSGYIRDQYNKPFSYVSDIPEHHKGEVKVAHVVSVSDGRGGTTRDGHYIAYNKYVEPGTVVHSYLIMSPDSDEPDDVAAIVDNEMIR